MKEKKWINVFNRILENTHKAKIFFTNPIVGPEIQIQFDPRHMNEPFQQFLKTDHWCCMVSKR